MDINTFFDKIFVINLDHRKDRWNESLKLFEKYHISNYERISAVKPIYKDIPKKYYSNLVVNQTEWYVTGAVGCKLSHLKVIKLAKERNYKNFLVLEDDFSIDKDNFEDIIQKVISEINIIPEWDMIYLGGNNLIKPNKIKYYADEKEGIFQYIHVPTKINTTHAYAMNSSIFDKCIEEIENCSTEIDDYYKRNIQNKMKVYCVYPSLMKQRKSVSDIFKNSVMDYKFD